MSHFRKIRSFRLICHVLAFIMAAPTFIMIAAIPVAAQQQAVLVGVVDFDNKSGYGPSYYGKVASDSLAVELKKSNHFDVTPGSVLNEKMKELGFTPPLTRRQLLRLGQEAVVGEDAGVSAMIEGEIAAIRVKGSPKRADVTLVVRMVDVASGELINGALVTGSSQLRVGYTADDQQLVTEAIDDACYQAVRAMVGYIIPEATVQNTIGTNEVLLNKGAREGIQRGMKMVVFRNGELVGNVQIKEVSPNDATAEILDAPRGVKPEDKVRAVFELPGAKPGKNTFNTSDGAANTSAGAPSSSHKKKPNPILALALLVLVGMAFKGGSGTNEVGSVTARAGFAPELPVPSGGVQVKWNPSKLGSGLNVLEYHIWRDNIQTPVGAPIPGIGIFNDAAGPTPVNVPYTQVDQVLHTKTAVTTNSVAPPAPGENHRYFVSAVYQVTPPGSTTPLFYETPRQSTGVATNITKMVSGDQGDLVTPASGETSVDPFTGIFFQFRNRLGADTYIVQISTSPMFTSPEFTSPQIHFSPNVPDSTSLISFTTGNISSYFGAIPANGTTVWWRVGARSSLDSPGPLKTLAGNNPLFLYSDSSTFVLPESPPAP